MTYSPDTDAGLQREWKVQFRHVPTNIGMEAKILLQGSSEAQTDAVFQAFVDRIAGMSNVEITHARKTTLYSSDVTPTA